MLRPWLLGLLVVCCCAVSAQAQDGKTYWQVHTGGGAAMSLEGGSLRFAEQIGRVAVGTEYFSGQRSGRVIRGVYSYSMTEASRCPPIYSGELTISEDGRSFALTSSPVQDAPRVNGCQHPRAINVAPIRADQIHWPSRQRVEPPAPPVVFTQPVSPTPPVAAVAPVAPLTEPESGSIGTTILKGLAGLLLAAMLGGTIWAASLLARERGMKIGEADININLPPRIKNSAAYKAAVALMVYVFLGGIADLLSRLVCWIFGAKPFVLALKYEATISFLAWWAGFCIDWWPLPETLPMVNPYLILWPLYAIRTLACVYITIVALHWVYEGTGMFWLALRTVIKRADVTGQRTSTTVASPIKKGLQALERASDAENLRLNPPPKPPDA
jgi:hypothetical protein